MEFFTYGGFRYSGGGALKDLLKEIETVHITNSEIRTFKDPYGLFDLSEKIGEGYRDSINFDNAIKDFLWLNQVLFKKPSKFSKIGADYKTTISKEYLNNIYDFVSNITEYKYKGFWHLILFKKSFFSQLVYKLKNKLLTIVKMETMYYPIVDKSNYFIQAKKLINSWFSEISSENKLIGLHNAHASSNPKPILDYFDKIKFIVVDRDPRDIFVNMINNKVGWMGFDYNNTDDNVKRFVSDFSLYRNNVSFFKEEKYCLYLRFEDLVYNYDDTVKKLFEFLDLDLSNHTSKFKYFNPNVSIKNIGIWKNYSNQNEIKYIENNLTEYLFTSK